MQRTRTPLLAEGVIAPAAAAETIPTFQKALPIAEEIGIAREVQKIKNDALLERPVVETVDRFAGNPALRKSYELHQRAKELLKPYSREFIPEPKARKLLHQTGIQTYPRPTGIPDNFKVRVTDKGAGIEYVHPTNQYISVRVMPGKRGKKVLKELKRKVPEGWIRFPLSSVTSCIQRGTSPIYINKSSIVVLNQKCIRNHELDFSKARLHYASQKFVNEEKFIQNGDILVNSTGVGTLGRLAQVWGDPATATVDSHITLVRSNSALVSPAFLGYSLINRESEMENLGEGSTDQTELSRHRLELLRFCV